MAKTLASQAKNGGSIPLARSVRPATPADAAAIAALAVASIRAYTWFAPVEWTPPGEEAEGELAGELVRRLVASAWGFVADDGDALAGVAMLLPATDANRPDLDPALAHLWQLFVAEAHWGSGLAVRLHRDAIDSAAARGFTSARLFTPAGQTRSRRFYEREGWAPVAAPFFDEWIGFEVVEYRRPLAVTGS
jgi:ribosomal protein S18 acetylase RimI-like enzyme